MTTALQFDLFEPAEPELPIARLSKHNHRCLHHEDCHWERHRVDHQMTWQIGIGRTEAGYFSTFGFQHATGGAIGPVFILDAPAPDFSSARRAALDRLLQALGTHSGAEMTASKRRLAAHVRRHA